jgi:polysaccharide export outer membrane protein
MLSTMPATMTTYAAEPGGDAAAGYLLQPGDALIVSVWKEPELQAELLVRQIESRLQRYLPDAEVTVAVKQIGGNYVYVIGKVNRPGQFSFSRPLDIMQALSLAGGATPYADVNDIRVLQRGNGGQRAVPFRYGEVERGRHLEQNIQLRSGDTVVVP